MGFYVFNIHQRSGNREKSFFSYLPGKWSSAPCPWSGASRPTVAAFRLRAGKKTERFLDYPGMEDETAGMLCPLGQGQGTERNREGTA